MVLESPYTNIRQAAAHVPITMVRPGGLCPWGSPSPGPPPRGKGAAIRAPAQHLPASLSGRCTACSPGLATSSWTRWPWATCSSAATRSECRVGRGAAEPAGLPLAPPGWGEVGWTCHTMKPLRSCLCLPGLLVL